jgi:hypothetical protein
MLNSSNIQLRNILHIVILSGSATGISVSSKATCV